MTKGRRGRKAAPSSSSEEEEVDLEQVDIHAKPVREELSEQEEEEDNNGDAILDEDDEDDDLDDELDEDEDSAPAKRQEDEELSPSDGEDDVEDDEEAQGDMEGESRLNAVGSAKFAVAMRRLLGASEDGTIPTTSEPTQLFQRKTKLMKMDETEKYEKLKIKRQLDERAKFDMKCVVPLPETDPSRINAERDLKKVATRGVVALFNAIGAHQRASASSSDATSAIGGGASKENFLKMLSEKAMGKVPSAAVATSGEVDVDAEEEEDEDEDIPAKKQPKQSSWKVLQEDYLENADEDGAGSEDDDNEEGDNQAIVDDDDDDDESDE